MTAPARVKQSDVARVIAGAIKGGMRPGLVRLAPDGTVEVYSEQVAPPAARKNPLDRLLEPR